MKEKLTREQLLEALSVVRIFAMDFDGTLTLGAFVFFNQEGLEMVCCSRRDSLGIDMLKKIGVVPVIISKETNPVVATRAKKMKIECVQALETGGDKLDALKSFVQKYGASNKEILYIGDDLPDGPCLEQAGVGIAVADAHPYIKKIADFVTIAEGGNGAIREVAELILQTKGVEIETFWKK